VPQKANKPITVLIADDEPVARAGIRALLTQAKDIEMIGEAQNGFEAKELIPHLRPQILLLDLKMPGPRPMDGIARNSLSSGAIGTHNLCARVIQLYMNSAPQGGYTTPACGNRIAGGSILEKKTKVVTSVFGKTWQVNTDHTFTKPGWSGWHTGLQAGPISL
jgi:hypothetical protein